MTPAHCTRLALVAATGLAVGCSRPAPPSEPAVHFVHAPGSPIAIGFGVARPLLADVNGDGAPDVVVSHSEPAPAHAGEPQRAFRGVVVTLVNDGHGTFRVHAPRFEMDDAGLKIAVGDVDGDRIADLAVVAHDRDSVAILRGDGTGGFARVRDVATGTSGKAHMHSVALADMNADGALDLVAGHSEDGAVAVLLGDGRGDFEPSEGSPFPARVHPYEGLAACDVDGDGDLDVVVPDLHGDKLILLRGDGRGALEQDTSLPLGTGPRPGFLGIGDLDGDAVLDVAVTHDDDALLQVFYGGPSGPGARSQRFELPTRDWGAVIGDVDRDGCNDLILGDHEHSVTVWYGGARFPVRAQNVPAGGRAPGYVAAGDVDGDGRLDVVTGNFESGDVSILLSR